MVVSTSCGEKQVILDMAAFVEVVDLIEERFDCALIPGNTVKNFPKLVLLWPLITIVLVHIRYYTDILQYGYIYEKNRMDS